MAHYAKLLRKLIAALCKITPKTNSYKMQSCRNYNLLHYAKLLVEIKCTLIKSY